MSETKKTCMYSTEGVYRCCDDPKDMGCFYDFPVGNPKSSYAPQKPPASVVEKFTNNAPLFENVENGEPVGLASGFVGQFQSLQ